MKKKVIILKGIVLLPENDIKLDLQIEKEKLEDEVLILSDLDSLEETIDFDNLPKIGTLATISSSITLPNNMIRITLTGLKRAKIKSLESDDLALIEVVEENIKDELYLKKLKKELKEYINLIPYVSNSILNVINKIDSLDQVSDIIAPYLQIDQKRLLEYLLEVNSKKRIEMILEDINKEKNLFILERDLDLKIKKQMDNNQKDFYLREKLKLIKEELNEKVNIDDEIDILRKRLKESKANYEIKMRIEKEINRYERMQVNSPEIGMVRNYIDWLLDLPYGIYTTDNDDLNDVREKLDNSHSGLEKVKTRIIEYLAIKQLTNCSRGPILCLVGPPGVGKTSLAFSIAEAMNRNFVKISVGGINDEAELIGHRRAYLGSCPGKIITSIKKAKSSNPVFLIDEIDKMVRNYKGDPASILLEVLDPEQNKYFKDNYIEEEYDLSKIMFIATANYIEDIPEALRDRLEIVNLSGYTEFEKLEIAKKYLLPKICKEYGINYNSIMIRDETILKIIREYTKESGVRELERLLATIIRKIITSLASKRISMNKFLVDKKKIEEYLGTEIYSNKKIKNSSIGVVNALAYTNYGGDILPIEVNYFKGNGKITLTGSLGDVMKESAVVALDYIKANHKYFKIDYEELLNNDIHIHIPESAVKKEGPSAGIALTTAIISAFKKEKIKKEVAFTGEITLRGDILPIGGLKEKSIGALRAGITKIFIPFDNKKDVKELPLEVLEKIEFIFVKNYKELYERLGDLDA